MNLESDPLRPHAHDPNPDPPAGPATILLRLPTLHRQLITLATLARLPQTAVPECTIVSTGHGASGPFTFGGVTLADLLAAYPSGLFTSVEVISADGFGARVLARELGNGERPILLATRVDGRALTLGEGLIRLIVPAENDDALRQVKWVRRIAVVRGPG